MPIKVDVVEVRVHSVTLSRVVKRLKHIKIRPARVMNTLHGIKLKKEIAKLLKRRKRATRAAAG